MNLHKPIHQPVKASNRALLFLSRIVQHRIHSDDDLRVNVSNNILRLRIPCGHQPAAALLSRSPKETDGLVSQCFRED